jgi:TetR/AcrR family transcriptional regulator, transcriptional repressor for nem operon
VRYPAKQKAETHDKILAAAARSFREHGAESNGIGSVMKELGLTKGGFYRHFESKDDLLAGAVNFACKQMGDGMVEAAKSAPPGRELQAIIDRYLSLDHVNSPGNGCVVATLGSEFSRQPVAIRKRIYRSLFEYRERILPFVPGRTPEEKRGRFAILFASMSGVLMNARANADPKGREEFLKAAKVFFTEAFTR